MGPRHLLTGGLLLSLLLSLPSGGPGPASGSPAQTAAGPGSGERVRSCFDAGEPVVCWEADPGLAALARRVVEEGSWLAPLPGLGPPGRVLGDTVRVWVVEDLDRAARRARPGAEAAGVEPWVAGFALGEQGLIVVGPGEAERGPGALSSLLRHELAHLALDAVAGPRVPRWLHEGYAQMAEGSWGWDRAWTLRLSFLRGEGPSLEQLTLEFPRAEPAARTAYLLSYTAVNHLVSLSGERGLRAFFSRLAAGEDVDGSMRLTYGITLGQFEDRWRKAVSDRYGWLYLLTRAGIFWIAISLFVIFAYWNRRRYDRARMEELRARERREETPRDRPWIDTWRWEDLESGPWRRRGEGPEEPGDGRG